MPSEQLALTPGELGADAIELVGADQPIEAYLDVQATEATEEIEAVTEPVDPAAEEPAARPPARRKRASVPSWDEIMFGGADKE